MENKTPAEIAADVGAPLDGLTGTQVWTRTIHPDLELHQLNYGQVRDPITFRWINHASGESYSKIPDEANSPDDAATVEDLHKNFMAAHKTIADLWPDILAAVPDLDENVQLVKGLLVGGKPMVADIVNGQIQNIRPEPIAPTFVLDDAGYVSIDKSNMVPEHAAALASVDLAVDGINTKAKPVTKTGG